MNDRKRPNHVIDSLFPVVLFFLFTISALVVILLAVRIYESTTDSSARSNISQAALIYVSEKVHQNDYGTEFSIAEIEGQSTLKMSHVKDKAGYTTYIYYYKDGLYELFIRDGITPSLSAGSFIAKVTDFAPEQISDKLLRLYFTDDKGNVSSTLVGTRSTTER